MNNNALQEWHKLSTEEKYFYINETAQKIGLTFQSVEKDWWVTHTLAIIFSMPYAKSLIFKGGTSLSKAWNIIERFSEDIDCVEAGLKFATIPKVLLKYRSIILSATASRFINWNNFSNDS